MVKVNFNAYNDYITDSLYQWDKNVNLVISGLNLTEAPEVHFSCYTYGDRALVRHATIDDAGVVTVKIPNSMLQQTYSIKAHIGIYENDTYKTIETITIPIKPRVKPEDYTLELEDEEFYSFNALENRINTIVASNNTTEGNSELIDIRTGHDGTVYGSAGDAVRSQIRNLIDDTVQKVLEAMPNADEEVF